MSSFKLLHPIITIDPFNTGDSIKSGEYVGGSPGAVPVLASDEGWA